MEDAGGTRKDWPASRKECLLSFHPVGLRKKIVAALVACAGTRTHRYGQVLLLYGHGRHATVYVADTGCGCGCAGGGGVLVALAVWGAFACSDHCRVQRRELEHHVFVLVGLVSVHGLSMLAQVVEAGMADKGAFAGVRNVILRASIVSQAERPNRAFLERQSVSTNSGLHDTRAFRSPACIA